MSIFSVDCFVFCKILRHDFLHANQNEVTRSQHETRSLKTDSKTVGFFYVYFKII